jgi:hypothetical protein
MGMFEMTDERYYWLAIVGGTLFVIVYFATDAFGLNP